MSTLEPSQRSPFSLTFSEVLFALLVGLGSAFGLRYFLWRLPPWNLGWCFPIECNESQFPEWFIHSRQQLFNTYVFPLGLFLALSAIFLFRALRNENLAPFSRLHNFAIAMPVILAPFVLWLGPFGSACSIFGIGPTVASLINWVQEKSGWSAWFTFFWYSLWIVLMFVYGAAWFEVFGD